MTVYRVMYAQTDQLLQLNHMQMPVQSSEGSTAEGASGVTSSNVDRYAMKSERNNPVEERLCASRASASISRTAWKGPLRSDR